jgi:hypothetical protein
MATEETVATAEETLATVPGKGEKVFNKEKKITEDISEEGLQFSKHDWSRVIQNWKRGAKRLCYILRLPARSVALWWR